MISIKVVPDVDASVVKEVAVWLIPQAQLTQKRKIYSDQIKSSFNDDIVWRIMFYPCGTREAKPDHTSIFLFGTNHGRKQQMSVSFSLSIVDADGKELIRRFASNGDFTEMPDLGFPKFCTRENALQFAYEGFLRIKLVLHYRRPNEVIQSKLEAANYLTEYNNLINNQDSDFFIELGDGSVLGLHKSILRLKWPYFRRMMAADMLESAESRMKVIGHTADTMYKMASFIYTCYIPIMSFAETVALFKAAHQYELHKLVNICVERLIKNLDFDNIVESQCLASHYELLALEMAVIKMLLKEKRKKKISKLSDLPNYKKLESIENHDALIRFSNLCFQALI